MVWFYFDDIIMLDQPWQADAAKLEGAKLVAVDGLVRILLDYTSWK